MTTQLLKLKFKGERNYLQGPDVFNETLAWLSTQRPEVRDIDFAFHRVASRQLKAVLGPVPEGIEPAAVCTFSSELGRERVNLLETDTAVAERYPYPEDEIVSKMAVNLQDKKAVLRDDIAYSDIEIWVAMTKALHYKVYPHLQGKWLFVRGRFPSYTLRSGSGERSLTISASFNDKLTRSDASLNGVKLGEIYFSIV